MIGELRGAIHTYMQGMLHIGPFQTFRLTHFHVSHNERPVSPIICGQRQ